jgi:hypothetical protein
MSVPMRSAPRRVVAGGRRAVDRRATSSPAVAIGRVGFAARGAVYLMVGWLALRAAVGIGTAEVTDKQGALEAVAQQRAGTALLIFISAGLLAYAAWSIIRAVFDPERRGHDAGALIARLGYVIGGFSYAVLGVSATKLALGGSAGQGSDAATQDWTAKLLEAPFGPPLVIVVGVAFLVVAAIEFGRAYSASFQKDLDLTELAPQRRWVIRVGRAGLAARGVVFALIGLFLIQAARQGDPSQAVGLGGALQKLAEQPAGPWLLGAVAAGLCMYGLFSIVEARYRRLKRG